ncbi:hypothetical protein F5Y08DRAFT_43326 [Xylaria arbuscula]|nr:hypothetical protein F5Y08DRAFT_43326 [Xylaria arbuscula]
MFICIPATFAVISFLAGQAIGKTDIGGCVSTQTVAYGGASLIWYVPDTGEICEFLDCGGGRAPPKTTVPGCPSYEGTATYSPSYLPGFGASATSTSSSASVSATESSSAPGDASSSEQTSSSPVMTFTGTVTSSTSASASASASTQTQTQSETQTGSDSDTASSSTAGSTSTDVSTGGAAMPTGSMKGPIGVMAGMAIGAAFL